jgi:copper resistance protein C
MRILAVILIFGWLASSASAHAFLDHADPKVGAVIKHAPPDLRIWYTEEVEPDFCTIEVTNDHGDRVDKNDLHRDDKDTTLLIEGLHDLPDGVYHVHWSVVAVDTHHTKGDFEFTVRSGG